MPNDARAMGNRAVALWMLGQQEAAKQDMQRALAKDPCVFELRLNAKQFGLKIPEAGCRYTDEQRAALDGIR
jgi:hypothetical protein